MKVHRITLYMLLQLQFDSLLNRRNIIFQNFIFFRSFFFTYINGINSDILCLNRQQIHSQSDTSVRKCKMFWKTNFSKLYQLIEMCHFAMSLQYLHCVLFRAEWVCLFDEVLREVWCVAVRLKAFLSPLNLTVKFVPVST
jgi:hypothetical protein